MNPIRHILIVGGGVAGWLTAAFLARTLGEVAGGVRVTLVQADDIGPAGVDEGTLPAIRGMLAAIGLDEARFVQACGATFRQGTAFADWSRIGERYVHPLEAPSQRPGMPELTPYWLLGQASTDDTPRSLADAVSTQPRVAGAARAPKRASDGDWVGPLNYAYHVDTARFAALLAEHAQSLGVERVDATVDRIELRGGSHVAAVVTREHGALTADLFVDCTGARATLIAGALGAAAKPVDDVLFVDRALTLQVPWPDADTAIPACTIATAQEAGWTWDIGLHGHRSVGHAWSSRHASAEQAERVLRRYVGPAAEAMTPRYVRLDTGYRETPWIGNCVAVGASAGLLEPLESSGVGLVESAVRLIARLLPADGGLEPAARQFNEQMRARFEGAVDFLKLHYALSHRDDTAFWRDNADPASWTPALRERLARWRRRPPCPLDFSADLALYPLSSWQYVLYGMGYRTSLPHDPAAWPRPAQARLEFARIAQAAQHALADLPEHRALVDALRARASSPAAQQPAADELRSICR